MSSLLGFLILLVHLAADVVVASSGESAMDDESFRLAIILVIVAVLLCVAAVIVCRFACVNFCSNGGYKKVDGDEDDNPKEVKVEAPPVSDEVEDLDSDSEVKQPLPESDPPDSPEEDAHHEDLSPSPSMVVQPPRYSNVASLPKYSESGPIPEEKPEELEAYETPASPTTPTTPLTEKEIENDKKEKAETEKEPVVEPSAPEEPVALTDDELALSSGEPEEEPRSSGSGGGASPDASNGTPPPPYAEARSRGGSEDRLADISESSNSPENSAPVDEEIAHIADTSSDSENMLDEAACNAPTLERPHVMPIDQPDAPDQDEPESAGAAAPRKDSTTGAAPPAAVEEDLEEVDGHDSDDGASSPEVPLEPVVKIESPGGPDESFDMDDYTPLPPTLRAHRLSGSERGNTM